MATETKELILRLPVSLYAWLESEGRNKAANRSSIEKEAIYRLEHSRELGQVSREFYMELQATDYATQPGMVLKLRGKKMFEMNYFPAIVDPAAPRPGYWVLSIHDHPVRDFGHHRLAGPRDALKLIRDHLSVLMLQWVAKQTQDGNAAAVEQAIEAQALISSALDLYERDCLDTRFEGIYYITQAIRF